MPKQFDSCVAGGGRTRTMKLKDGRYFHVCFPKGGGPSVKGETHAAPKKSFLKK